MWLDVYKNANELSKEEQLAFFNALKNDLFPDEPDKLVKLLAEIRKTDLTMDWFVFIAEVTENCKTPKSTHFYCFLLEK